MPPRASSSRTAPSASTTTFGRGLTIHRASESLQLGSFPHPLSGLSASASTSTDAATGVGAGGGNRPPLKFQKMNGVKRTGEQTGGGADEDEDGEDEEEDEDGGEEAAEGAGAKGKKGKGKAKHPQKRNASSTGRKKIAISYIDDKARRNVTFTKRKSGLMKKAFELSTLTGTQCLVVVVSESGTLYTFATPRLAGVTDTNRGKTFLSETMEGLYDAEVDGEDGEVEVGGSQAPSRSPVPRPASAGMSAAPYEYEQSEAGAMTGDGGHNFRHTGSADHLQGFGGASSSAVVLPDPPADFSASFLHNQGQQQQSFLPNHSSSSSTFLHPPLPTVSAAAAPHTQHSNTAAQELPSPWYPPTFPSYSSAAPPPSLTFPSTAPSQSPHLLPGASPTPTPLTPYALARLGHAQAFASYQAAHPYARVGSLVVGEEALVAPSVPAEASAAASSGGGSGGGAGGRTGSGTPGGEAMKRKRTIEALGLGEEEDQEQREREREKFEANRERMVKERLEWAARVALRGDAGLASLPSASAGGGGDGGAEDAEAERRRELWKGKAQQAIAEARSQRTLPLALRASAYHLSSLLPSPPPLPSSDCPAGRDFAYLASIVTDQFLHHASFERMCSRAQLGTLPDQLDTELEKAVEEFTMRWLPHELSRITPEFVRGAQMEARVHLVRLFDFLEANEIISFGAHLRLISGRKGATEGTGLGEEVRKRLYGPTGAPA